MCIVDKTAQPTVEVLEVDEEEDSITREAALSDRVDLVEAVSGMDGKAKPKLVITRLRLPSQHPEEQGAWDISWVVKLLFNLWFRVVTDTATGHRRWGVRSTWNGHMQEWQAFFNKAGVSSAKLPNMGRRFAHLLGGMEGVFVCITSRECAARLCHQRLVC